MQTSTDTLPKPGPYDYTAAHAVASFINSAARDENGRCMATAMLTLSMWQTAPEPFAATVPSVLLVNAGDAKKDPLDDFAEEFFFNSGTLEQSLSDGSHAKYPNMPGDADKAMRLAVCGARELIASNGSFAHSNHRMQQFQNDFHIYRNRDHGDGPGFRYTRAWTEDYGWLSGDDNRLVLRLDQADDRKALRHDLLTKSRKLHDPRGFGRELKQVPKKLALSGSLHSGEWDEALVTQMLTSGWPVLFIPHSLNVPLCIEQKTNLHLATMKTAAHTWGRPVAALDLLPDDPWLLYHYEFLRSRLAFMPVDYGFAIESIVRQLLEVCARLAHAFCRDTNDGHVTTLIGQDLYRMTLRAIVIGVTALGYHCWGFATRSRPKAVALLHHLRTQGSWSRRDLQRRFQTMDSMERDELLKILEKEGLIECVGKRVSAVSLSNFIERLQGRPDIPQPGSLSNLVLGRKASMADPFPGMDEEKRRRPSQPAQTGGDAPEAETGEADEESLTEPEPETPDCHGAVA